MKKYTEQAKLSVVEDYCSGCRSQRGRAAQAHDVCQAQQLNSQQASLLDDLIDTETTALEAELQAL
ncbi:hypothetical protein ACVBEG_17395 [Pseudomonas sp. GG8]